MVELSCPPSGCLSSMIIALVSFEIRPSFNVNSSVASIFDVSVSALPSIWSSSQRKVKTLSESRAQKQVQIVQSQPTSGPNIRSSTSLGTWPMLSDRHRVHSASVKITSLWVDSFGDGQLEGAAGSANNSPVSGSAFIVSCISAIFDPIAFPSLSGSITWP